MEGAGKPFFFFLIFFFKTHDEVRAWKQASLACMYVSGTPIFVALPLTVHGPSTGTLKWSGGRFSFFFLPRGCGCGLDHTIR